MLVQREAAIGYRMMRKEAGGLAEPCGSAPAMSDSGGGTAFILPVSPHSFTENYIPTGIDKYNKKIMVVSIKDPDLFRVNNKFAHDRYTKRLGCNPLVKRCGTNPALRVSCSTYHDE
jgi:hypothetical protein